MQLTLVTYVGYCPICDEDLKLKHIYEEKDTILYNINCHCDKCQHHLNLHIETVENY